MADAVRKEERDRAGFDQGVRLAAEEAEVDEPLGDDAGGGGVHVEPLSSRCALLDCRGAGGGDERVQGLLLGCE